MTDAQLHPGLPVHSPTDSYWQIPPHSLANLRTTPDLPTDTVFNHVIIGSGLSGAAIAYELLRHSPKLKILMLEARNAASGASTRNTGQYRAEYWVNFRRDVEAFGEDEALKIERFEEDSVMDIVCFVGASQAECDFRNVTTADAYMSQDTWCKARDVLETRGQVRDRRPNAGPLTSRILLEGEQAQRALGMADIVGAVTWPAYTLNPYRLVCCMLERSVEKGLDLQTNTPAYRVKPHTQLAGYECQWVIESSRGIVHTRNVVLATDAYTNALYPELAATGFLTPGRSHVTAIRSGTDMSSNISLTGSIKFNNVGRGDNLNSYAFSLSSNGDVICGNVSPVSSRHGDETLNDGHIDAVVARNLHRAPAEIFGQDALGDGGENLRDWTAINGYTTDMFPLIGEAPNRPGLWILAGMNGRDLALAYRSATALVHMMTTGKEPSWFPTSFRLSRAWDSQ